MNKQSSVYIMTNKHRTVLYIGATNNLPARIKSHKNGMADGFSNKYCCHYLVHVELYDEWLTAINRERQLKKWKRAWKYELIDEHNASWRDLSLDI